MNEEEKQTIERIKRDYELAKSEDAIDIDIFTEDIKTVLNLLENKDKMIDLMGEKIFEEGIVWENKEDVKQYYERKVENGN